MACFGREGALNIILVLKLNWKFRPLHIIISLERFGVLFEGDKMHFNMNGCCVTDGFAGNFNNGTPIPPDFNYNDPSVSFKINGVIDPESTRFQVRFLLNTPMIISV